MESLSFQERAGKPGGGKGILIQDERTGALSTLNNQSVAYGICSYASNSMKSSNPNSGIYEAETSRTLDNNGGSPDCNQGGIAVVQSSGLVTKGNGECFLTSEKHMSLSTGGGQAGQGYPAVCIENHPQDSRVKIVEDGMVQTLSSRMGTGGGNVPMVMEQGFAMQAIGEYKDCDCASSLKQRDYKDSTDLVIHYGVDCYNQSQSQEVSKALNSIATDSDHIPCTYGLDRAAYNQEKNAKYNFSIEEEKIGAQVAKGSGAVCARDYKGVGSQYVDEGKCVVGSLCARDYKGVGSQYVDEGKCVVGSLCARDYKGSVVRRLTPLECERLQGYPSGWTDIGEWIDSKGKKHKDADSPRYKALGNSIALPFWYYLLKRISATYDENYKPTLGSLFDGIGGFPLCWESINGTGTARWASEIEEFPIAVTKKRFGED